MSFPNDKPIPTWPAGGSTDVCGLEFQSLRSSLVVVASALHGVCALESFEPAMMTEALRLYGRGLDLAKTLRTLCRAHLGLKSTDTNAVSERAEAARIEAAMTANMRRVFEALLALPETDPHFTRNEPLALWRAALLRRRATSPYEQLPPRTAAFAQDVAESVMGPVRALHTHLTSTMALEVKASDGIPRTQGFGASIAVLKNADDPMLRRTTFEAMNAWLASHAASFLDVLNAHTGFRAAVLRQSAATEQCSDRTENTDRSAPDLFAVAMKAARMDPMICAAMFDAIEAELPRIRESVRMRQHAFGPGPMRIWNLLSPSPDALYAKGRFFWDALARIDEAAKPLDPAFSKFLHKLVDDERLDAGGSSMRSGAWVDDLPASDSVLVLSNFIPTLSGEASLAHLLGAAWQMQSLHGAPAGLREAPLSMTELAGSFYETVLARTQTRRSRGTPNEKLLRWQALRRITNCLLAIPARHRLLRQLLEYRQAGVLSLKTVNDLSTESWRHYFGDSTVGEDRYVWAYKSHFYRPQPIFYDWQYTFGFIASQILVDLFEDRGASACGADLETVWLESGRLSVEEFGLKHLGADLRSLDFWRTALNRALLPVRELAGREDYFAR